MAENYKGGPVGLGDIAVAVGEEEHTLEEVYEPFLTTEGYLREHLRPNPYRKSVEDCRSTRPKDSQMDLFRAHELILKKHVRRSDKTTATLLIIRDG